MTSPYAQAPVNLSTLLYLKGHIYLLSGQPIPALEYFQKAFRVNLRVGNGLMMVAELATYSHYAMALNLLQQVDDAYKNGKDNIVASRDFTSDIKNLFLEINSSLNDAKKNNLK
jgi:tetratricopeptide (TPR) repeat protein